MEFFCSSDPPDEDLIPALILKSDRLACVTLSIRAADGRSLLRQKKAVASYRTPRPLPPKSRVSADSSPGNRALAELPASLGRGLAAGTDHDAFLDHRFDILLG